MFQQTAPNTHPTVYLPSQQAMNKSKIVRNILDFIPIASLSICSLVSRDWNLIVKYLVPVPLLTLKILCVAGELLYWLPGKQQMPKTVSLKLHFNSKENTKNISKNELENENENHSYLEIVLHPSSKTNRQHKSTYYSRNTFNIYDILYIIEGHWTPIFESLVNCSYFNLDEEQMFNHSKCFSIITNTYMTYDFLSFNKNSNHGIVRTLRKIIHQTSSMAKKMAIHSKANNLYVNQEQPLIFTNHLAILNFELFILHLQNYIRSLSDIEEISIYAEKKMSASVLYPQLLEQNVQYSLWKSWIKSHVSRILLQNNDDDGSVGSNISDIEFNSEEFHSSDFQESCVPTVDRKSLHVRRKSSLFGQKVFPMDSNLFELSEIIDDVTAEVGQNESIEDDNDCVVQ